MDTLKQFGIPAIAALIFAILLIPVVKKVAVKIGLIDKPNARKVHLEPVPLAGGVSIAITTGLSLLLSSTFIDVFSDNIIWISGAMIMLIIGVLDDRFNVKPIYRLIIQLACAYAVAASGIRITSFYGMLGIHEIPISIQYILTIIVIAGVVNAYNLMDGIDGLLGSLTLVGSSVLAIVAYQFHRYELTVLYVALIGSVIGFLRYNLSSKKIFMGDAGSLFLGFILVVTAIKLLNATHEKNPGDQLKILLLVGGIFLIPVFDSLRVYRARIKKGISPFKADKTHLHHLFLYLGITHKKATLLIVILVILITAVIGGLIYLIPVVWVILTVTVVLIVVIALLTINQSVLEWTKKLKEIEKGD